MESYRGFYEYPSSQAAIYPLSLKNGGNVTPAKSKRTWGSILRIPGRSKKERENVSQQATVYSPQFNLPQSYSYGTPNYQGQNTQFISSTPYRDPNRYYSPAGKERYGNYNATYSRASISPLQTVINPAKASAKNTVRYTDWFGSVVGRKPPIRPALPAFHSSAPSSAEKDIPAVLSWDKYIAVQSAPAAVEVPALVSVANYNTCMCPDQIFATKSKRKKKCKQCGKKYGTLKNQTAIGSVTRIRPAIPPSFYKVPTNAQWAWPQNAALVYSQPLPISGRPNQQLFRGNIDDSEESPPLTPETVRTVRSGNSSRSNGSNSTITQDSFFSPRSIPPPPSVPLPSIPQSSKTSYQGRRDLKPSLPKGKKEDKGNSIFGSVKTAYELIESSRNTSSASDFDELSDNAVYDSWERRKSSSNDVKTGDTKSPDKDQSGVSVISIGGNGSAHITNNVEGSIITSVNKDSNRVRIFNSSSPSTVTGKSYKHNSKVKTSDRLPHKNIQERELSKDVLLRDKENDSLLKKSSPSYPSEHSSHINKNNHHSVNGAEDESSSCYSSSSNESELIDNTKVVSIAGQRILLNQKQRHRPSKENTKKQHTVKSIPEISDWDSLQEYVASSTYNTQQVDDSSSEATLTNGFESPDESESRIPDPPKPPPYLKPVDFKRNIISPDIRDTIHEEEEEQLSSKEEDEHEDIKMNSFNVDTSFNTIENNLRNATESKDVGNSNSFSPENQNEEIQDSGSSPGETSRMNGFQPTLSELLQVKSILKRPNSLDTSSETDSDFYLPALSEFKQNLRKKKSVQFRQSDEVTLVEGSNDNRGRKVSSLKAGKKDRRRREKEIKVTHVDDNCHDSSLQNGTTHDRPNDFTSDLSMKYDSNWTFIEEKDLGSNSDDLVSAVPEDNLVNGSVITDEPTRDQDDHVHSNNESESSTQIRRSHSQRQAGDTSGPLFNDTYRLRQTSLRPPVPFTSDSPSGQRRPTRKAPPPPKNTPVRPTVPPPPPPLPPTAPSPDTESLRSSDAGAITCVNGLGDEACDNDAVSSLSSTSLSPPPSPPPPLPSSSPPPLPSSSPPPLDDEEDPIDLPCQEVPFSSFMDSRSLIPISTKMPSIPPSSSEISIQDLKHTLSTSSSSSIFDVNDDDALNLATIKGRVMATKSSGLGSKLIPSSTHESRLTNYEGRRRLTRSSNSNPSHRLSFLSSMVEETDVDERLSDHIYEELPSYPSSPTNGLPNFQEKSIFDGASKYEILEFLQDARSRVDITADEEDMNLINPLSAELSSVALDDDDDQTGVDGQDDPLLPSRYMDGRSSNRSSNSESSENSGLLRSDKERLAVADIERTDSGVGSETSKPHLSHRHKTKSSTSSSSTTSGSFVGIREGDLPPCNDCDTPVEAKVTNSGLMYAPLVCRRCCRRRQERKEILTEIIETEVKYGRDLKVMMEQFCRPMRVAGLLSRDQLNRIFLNIDELIDHNQTFSLQLRDAYEIALDQGDEDFLTVNVAKLFLHASPMLHAFQNYCVRQGAASILLQNLEKEKELFRIFLRVSQMENTLLRRMNLHSFLMVPVQRVTKYPLLLARLYKATPPSHPSREDCRRAREKIELYLQHINNETKNTSPTKLWRRISMSVGNNTQTKWFTQPLEYDTSLKLRTVVLDVLDWGNDEVCIVREGRLLCLPPESTNWTRRGRGIKMASVQMVLVTLGRPKVSLEEKVPEDGLITPCDLGIREAVILAFKDHRLTKSALIRDPWYLSRTVVTWDEEGESECFELTELTNKETFIFKDRECVGTEEWFRSIQFHALSVGTWRRRRPALANIMINGANRS